MSERELKAEVIRESVDEWVKLSDPERMEKKVHKWARPEKTQVKVKKQRLSELFASDSQSSD